MMGCSTTTNWEFKQRSRSDFRPGNFLGCTWEAGSCFDYCEVSEWGQDDNFDYGNATKVNALGAKNIGNFQIGAQKAAFVASVGEVFAAKALVCSQDDDSCDDYNDDDDDNDETYKAASGCIRK